MANPFSLRGVYNFTTNAPHILKTEFRNAVCVGMATFATASKTSDVATIHSQVYPSLPAGTPSDFRQIDYVVFNLPSGQQVTLGLPWIKASSIVEVQSVTITAVINANEAADLEKIRNALASVGITDVAYTVS